LVWFRASRAPFLTASLVSVLLGAAVARWDGYSLSMGLLALTLVGVALLHAGVNLGNDYYDHHLGSDGINRYRSPFNGGAGLIQSGELSPGSVGRAAAVCIGLAALCGIVLALYCGPVILALMVAGFVLGVGYSADPLQLMRTGWGEAVAGLCCGPLVAFGTYFVQTRAASWTVVWPSLPVGLLVSAILVINEVPDFEADGAVAKSNLVVRKGQGAGITLHRWLLYVTYGLIAFFPMVNRMPWLALAALITLPAARRALSLARSSGGDPARIVPVSAGTVKLHTAIGLLVTIGYLVRLPG